MEVNSVPLLIHKIVQVLGSVKKPIHVAILALVGNWIAEGLDAQRSVLLLNLVPVISS